MLLALASLKKLSDKIDFNSTALSIKDIDLKTTCDKTKANALMIALTTLSSSEIINSSTWEGEATQDQLRSWLLDRTGQIAGPVNKLHAKGSRVPFFRELFKQVLKVTGVKDPKTEALPSCIDLEATASITGPVSGLDFISHPLSFARLIRNCIVDGKPVKVLQGSTDDCLILEVTLINAANKDITCTFEWDTKALREQVFANYNAELAAASKPKQALTPSQASPEFKEFKERLDRLGHDVNKLGTDVREQQQSTAEFLSFTEGTVCDA